MKQSNCCGATSTYHKESDLCPECYEHCEWEECHDFTDYPMNRIILGAKRKPLRLWPAIITLACAIAGLLICGYIDDVWSMWL